MHCSPLLLVGSLALTVSAFAQTDIAGGWVGEYYTPGPGRHHLLIEFAETPQGWVGGADISVYDPAAPLSLIHFDGSRVRFEADAEGDTRHWVFRGSISEDRNAIDGTVTHGPDSHMFHLERDDAALGLLASSSESLGEFHDCFAGRWHSKLPDANEHTWLQIVLRRTTYGFTGERENWGMDRMIRKIAVNGASIRIEMPTTAAVFEGAIDSEGTNIVGVWSVGGAERPFTLRRYVGDPGLGH